MSVLVKPGFKKQGFNMMTKSDVRCSKFRAFAFSLHVLAVLLGICGSSNQSRAQCSPVWQPFDAATGRLPGVYGVPNSRVAGMRQWDPDGNGPGNPVIVMWGRFDIAGTVGTCSIATFDPATGVWRGFGEPSVSPLSRFVQNVVVLPDNSLVAGADRDWLASSMIARWDGQAWSPWPLESARLIGLTPAGEVLASGRLDTSQTGGLYKRVGDAWVPFQTRTSVEIRAVANAPDGSLYVCSPSAVFRYNPAEQDFDPIGPTFSGGWIDTIYVQPGTGTLFAAGFFNRIGSQATGNIVRWTGTNWQTIGTHADWPGQNSVQAMTTLPNGDLVVVGEFRSVNGVSALRVASWNGVSWTGLSMGSTFGLNSSSRGASSVLVGPDDRLYVGSAALDPELRYGIARRTATGWESLTNGSFAEVYAMVETPEGLVVGGSFKDFGGVVNANNIARLTSNGWEAMGLGFNRPVRSLLRMPDGTLLAGGEFFRSGEAGTAFIAQWDGSNWVPLNGPLFGQLNGAVKAMVVASDGDLIVGGSFNSVNSRPALGIARFDSAIGWRGVGPQTSNATRYINVNALYVASDGALWAGGLWRFPPEVPSLGQNLARWDGTEWTAGIRRESEVFAINELSPGEIIIAGPASDFSVLARFADGRLFAVGNSPPSVVGLFARVGDAWVRQTDQLPANGLTGVLLQRPNGDVVAGGSFSRIGERAANGIARWAPLPNCTPCDSIDFNQDGLFPDDNDVVLFFWVFAGANCATCSDIDFNNDGLFPDDNDLIAFLRVLAGGTCGG